MDADPYRALGLAREHVDSLEALWLRQDAERFACRGASSSQPERAELHVRGLALREREAIGEASLRVGSTRYAEAYASARVLGRLAPDACVDPRGRVTLRFKNMLAIAAGLADAGVVRRVAMDDEASVLAAALARAPTVPAGALLAQLGSRRPLVGLIAASVQTQLQRPATLLIENVLVTGTREEQAFAVLALSRAGSYRGDRRPALAAVLDGLVSEDAYAGTVEDPRLVALALVGGAPTARKLLSHHRTLSPSVLWALGVLGVPRTSDILVDALGDDDPARAQAALRALYFMTGELFARGEVREDGANVAPERMAARRFMSGWEHATSSARFHLGQPLAANAAHSPGAASSRLLRSWCVGVELPAASILPGLHRERPRRFVGMFDLLPPPSWRGDGVLRPRGPDFEAHVRELART